MSIDEIIYNVVMNKTSTMVVDKKVSSEKILSLIAEAKKLILEELLKALPAEAKFKWGSENQNAYEQYAHGFNSCLKEVEETLRRKFQ